MLYLQCGLDGPNYLAIKCITSILNPSNTINEDMAVLQWCSTVKMKNNSKLSSQLLTEKKE